MNWNFLEQLLSRHSVSGNEDQAIKCYEEYLQMYCHAIRRDALNNCYAVLNPSSERRIMIEAHIDEIGFQVTYIDDNGFIYIRQNGGIDHASAIGSAVIIHTADGGEIEGIIGKRPIHVQKPDERMKLPELDELWIDTGLGKDDVRSRVAVGDFVSFAANFRRLGPDCIVSKGLDDKVGVYVVAETMRRLAAENLGVGVYGVAAVQEEVGCKGAKVCASNVDPQMAFSIDVGFSTDVPNMSKKKYGDIAFGKGVVINHHTDCNLELIRMMRNVAIEKQIAYQDCANSISTGGTDALPIQTSLRGVKTLLLSIPNRYMHTQVEMCDIRDIESAVDLLVATIMYIDRNELI